MSNKILDTVHKLIMLAGNNPNEFEKTQAALKACALIRAQNITLILNGESIGGKESSYEMRPENNIVIKEFYQKIVAMNGTPKEAINTNPHIRCELCRLSLGIGNIHSYIPKTRYAFHVTCWSKLKVRTAPR